MEELFENKTKFSQKEYNTFLKSYKEEYATSETLYMVFNIIFFGFSMIYAFISGEILLGLILLVGILIYLWYKIIRTSKRVYRDMNSEKLSGKFVNTYKFYKNYFKVENPDGNAQIAYFKLYRIVETNTHYYIYLSREAAFIVSKIGFTKGTATEFSEFLRKKVFFKYKNRIKKSHT